MQIRSFRRACLLFWLLLLLFPLVAGCDVLPKVTIGLNDPTPTTDLNIWHNVAKGVETRMETWNSPNGDGASDTVRIVRFNLDDVKLNVDYQPDHPLSMEDWMAQEHQPVAIINGGFFDGSDHATGLVVADGQAYGSSYDGLGGMLAVDAEGNVQVRSLIEQPYSSDENLTEATQCWPMLVLNGKRTQFDADKKASPRSVVAMDKEGRLLFIVSPNLAFSLDDLGDILPKTDLDLVNALNLDGGSSTGLYVNATDSNQSITLNSYVNLPIVVVVKEKSS